MSSILRDDNQAQTIRRSKKKRKRFSRLCVKYLGKISTVTRSPSRFYSCFPTPSLSLDAFSQSIFLAITRNRNPIDEKTRPLPTPILGIFQPGLSARQQRRTLNIQMHVNHMATVEKYSPFRVNDRAARIANYRLHSDNPSAPPQFGIDFSTRNLRILDRGV